MSSTRDNSGDAVVEVEEIITSLLGWEVIDVRAKFVSTFDDYDDCFSNTVSISAVTRFSKSEWKAGAGALAIDGPPEMVLHVSSTEHDNCREVVEISAQGPYGAINEDISRFSQSVSLPQSKRPLSASDVKVTVTAYDITAIWKSGFAPHRRTELKIEQELKTDESALFDFEVESFSALWANSKYDRTVAVMGSGIFIPTAVGVNLDRVSLLTPKIEIDVLSDDGFVLNVEAALSACHLEDSQFDALVNWADIDSYLEDDQNCIEGSLNSLVIRPLRWLFLDYYSGVAFPESPSVVVVGVDVR